MFCFACLVVSSLCRLREIPRVELKERSTLIWQGYARLLITFKKKNFFGLSKGRY